VDANERVLAIKMLAREKFVARCAQLPAGCVVAMESSSSHHWARRQRTLGAMQSIPSGIWSRSICFF